jgi:transcriptional regulator NrdR family protein
MNQPMKRSVTEDAPKGLVCRSCGCRHFRVLYTRRAWGGRLQRRRECRHCGRRITTYEQPAGALV